MDWNKVGSRIRKQREYLGYTREAFAEKIDVTPKFCSDIELGVKGMSVTTLCKIADALSLSTDYILFGTEDSQKASQVISLLDSCPEDKLIYLENIIKSFIMSTKDK